MMPFIKQIRGLVEKIPIMGYPVYYRRYLKIRRKKYYIAGAGLGLCNRLKALISAMRLADEFKGKAFLYWPENRELSCKYSDLFEKTIDEITKQDLDQICNGNEKNNYEIISSPRLQTLPKDRIKYNFGKAWHPAFPFMNIDCEYERIPLRVINSFLPYVKKIIPCREVSERIAEYSQKFDQHTLGVLLRTWKNDMCRDREKLFSLDSICEAINHREYSKLFVASDSDNALKFMEERYKGKIIIIPRQTFCGNRLSKEGLQDALVNMFLLSKCKQMIGSYLSTFLEIAWWIGGCKGEVARI